MKYKIGFSILTVMLSITSAFASDKIHVSAMESFSSTAPLNQIDVSVLEDAELGTYSLKHGDIIHCRVLKVTGPKRGKRSASFAVCPISYTSGSNDVNIDGEFYGKYAEKIISKEEIKNIDKKEVGKKTAKTVGNYFVKGVAPVASLAEGMIKNEEGNRLESGIKQVYKDSPISYVEKGKDLNIEKGQSFYLIFKSNNENDSEE